MNLYDFQVKKMNGQEVKMEEYKGNVVLIVNTASKCKLTPQFKELEELYKEIKWNFTKFLIDKEGKVVKRYSPTTKPLKIKDNILKLLHC